MSEAALLIEMLKLTSVRQSLCTAACLAIMLSVICRQAVLEDGRH